MNKKPSYNIKSQIRSALRRVWLYSPLRREALAKARISRGIYRCQKCKECVGPKLIEIDHIIKATPDGGINEPEDWGIFIKNLLYCGLDGLVALCKSCHAIKTKEERANGSTKKKTKGKKKATRRPKLRRP